MNDNVVLSLAMALVAALWVFVNLKAGVTWLKFITIVGFILSASGATALLVLEALRPLL